MPILLFQSPALFCKVTSSYQQIFFTCWNYDSILPCDWQHCLRWHLYCCQPNYQHYGQPLECCDSLNGEGSIPSNRVGRRSIDFCSPGTNIAPVSGWCWWIWPNSPEQISNIQAVTKLTAGFLPPPFKFLQSSTCQVDWDIQKIQSSD